MKYCESLADYRRFKTRVVKIGDLLLGGDNPIRVQSMTTTDTMDTQATVEQSIRMIEAGCELVRITAPSMKEAENLKNIREELRKRGYHTPLVADIHYTPNAAELAARIVEKVRINPGNYADKKKFEYKEYTDAEYQAELERIYERFSPLVKICKEYGTAMRIGTNHGSLSDRILSRYGDTPKGMVESAMEFIRICEDHGYYNLVISMKASNPQVMVQAYRLLVAEMMQTGRNYPLHLGVTEAGDGEDGRIKSAVGIGCLLEDGLGDTIRVSLTEEPEAEIPVAKALAERYSKKRSAAVFKEPEFPLPYSPFAFEQRSSQNILSLGGKNVPVVVADYSDKQILEPSQLFACGHIYHADTDKWTSQDTACDYVYAGSADVKFEPSGNFSVILDYEAWKMQKQRRGFYPLLDFGALFEYDASDADTIFIQAHAEIFKEEKNIELLKKFKNGILLLSSESEFPMKSWRCAITEFMNKGITLPVVFRYHYSQIEEEFLLYASTDIGSMFIDGMGDGVMISHATLPRDKSNFVAFGILQACRRRISRTEYISCPSCGRTLFDLQETTRKIKEKTDHLKGIKIGIMGCIVNGPGEMADADYGYVGSGPGKISLYKGKNLVKRNVDTEKAVDALIELIRENGDWVERT
ncbi:MAG: (E)-4-hydroxy-3-methylbut-2-enyl-diphosphate synthase [Bacteroidia bacterium]|nr:(E)-4-hydroxy-3-methylbut-2-enyl-diphosphate synthase [Bacteroidia bacterium]